MPGGDVGEGLFNDPGDAEVGVVAVGVGEGGEGVQRIAEGGEFDEEDVLAASVRAWTSCMTRDGWMWCMQLKWTKGQVRWKQGLQSTAS